MGKKEAWMKDKGTSNKMQSREILKRASEEQQINLLEF